MNKILFMHYLTEYLIPTIRALAEKLPEVTNVVVQLDQAGGHGGGRANMGPILHQLNGIGAREAKKVTFITQCSRYPLLI